MENEKKMKYMHLEVPESSEIFKKIKKIRERTGINSNLNAVIYAVINYKFEEDDSDGT